VCICCCTNDITARCSGPSNSSPSFSSPAFSGPAFSVASIVQGSAIGPVSYVVNAADLLPITPGNEFCKYADDTYLIIPANNVNTRMAEINNIKTWACANNLTLNLTKTVEIVFVDSKRRRQVQPPSPLATISRVSSLKVLGVTISSQMSVSEHVSTVIS